MTFLALACFCLSSLPIPICTVEVRDKDFSQPYPCQNSPCGCKSAEQCWKSCCCNTPAERLAWAKKNGVTPPSYVVALTKSPAKPKSACCSQKSSAQKEHSEPTKVADSGTRKPASEVQQSRKIVLSVCALECQGRSSAFTLLPWTILVTSQSFTFSPRAPKAEHRSVDVHPASIDLEPDTPPPRQYLS